MGFAGTAAKYENAAKKTEQDPGQQVDDPNAIVFHQSAGAWIRPQKDPYALENFRDAYHMLASVEKQIDEPRATHYALKIYPRNEREQWAVEKMKDVKTAYIPFDYVALTEAEVSAINPAAAAAKTLFPDTNPHKVVQKGIMSTAGKLPDTTYDLPILYVVWPVEKPLPAELEYVILYEVCLPQSGHSSAVMRAVEREAISLALGTRAIAATRAEADRTLTGKVEFFDGYLWSQGQSSRIPQANLIQRFQLGSAVWDATTNAAGVFSVTGPIPDNASYSHVFLQDEFKVTSEFSTTPYVSYIGTVASQWGNGTDISLCLHNGTMPVYDLFPAANHFFHVQTDIPLPTYLDNGIRIIAADSQNAENGGYFSFGNPAAGIDPLILIRGDYADASPNSSDMHCVVFHELGHYAHSQIIGGIATLAIAHPLMVEGFSTYCGWRLPLQFYRLHGLPLPNDDTIYAYSVTMDNRQMWLKVQAGYYYSPMLTDLVDDFNQSQWNGQYYYQGSPAYFVDDRISGVPNNVILEIAKVPAFPDIRTKIASYIGTVPSLTQENFDLYIADYQYWFDNNSTEYGR